MTDADDLELARQELQRIYMGDADGVQCMAQWWWERAGHKGPGYETWARIDGSLIDQMGRFQQLDPSNQVRATLLDQLDTWAKQNEFTAYFDYPAATRAVSAWWARWYARWRPHWYEVWKSGPSHERLGGLLMQVAGVGPEAHRAGDGRGGRWEQAANGSAQREACAVLGIAPDATPAEIQTAYRRMAQQYHPDKVAHLAPEFKVLAERRMKEINAAYHTLMQRHGAP